MRRLLMLAFIFGVSAFMPEVRADWTVFIYMNGDNDLEAEGLVDFMEASSVGSTGDVDIVIQFDRIDGYSTGYGDWTICHRFHVTKGMQPVESSAVQDWGDGLGGREVDMAAPETLIDFGIWSIDHYPSEHYLMVIWNHGDGWHKGAKGSFWSKGMNDDYTSDTYMEITNGEWETVAGGIRSHLGRNIDIIGFDACYMQMIEVEYVNRHYFDYMTGSEEWMGSDGWAYDTVLAALTATPGMSPSELSCIIVNACVDYSWQNTYSAIDLSKLDDLALKLNDMAYRMIEAENQGYGNELADIRDQVQKLDIPGHMYKHIDLYDLAERVSIHTSLPSDLKTAAAELMNIFPNAVVLSRCQSGQAYQGINGIAIYYPDDPNRFARAYRKLELADDTLWDEFISDTPPEFTPTPAMPLGVELSMPDAFFSPGEACRLDAAVNNDAQPYYQVPLFVLLQVGTDFWYWPEWTMELNFQRIDAPSGSKDITIIQEFTWPDTGTDSMSGITFWGAMLDESVNDILGDYDQYIFGFGP